MALYGTFYGTTSNPQVKPKITWSAVQNIAENYSDVTAVLTYSRTNTGYRTYSTWYGSISINGHTQEGMCHEAEVTYNSDTEVFRCTQRVYHNADGSCQIQIAAEGYFYQTSVISTEIFETVTLDPTQRAARIAASDANIGAVSTVTVTGLQPGCAYCAEVSFGAATGYLTADGMLTDTPVLLTGSTIAFAIPECFYYEIPNAPTGVCTLTCTTYLGAEQIGQTQTGVFTVTASKELCVPVVSGTVEDINPVTVALTGDHSVLVLGASTALCTISAEAKYGASITDQRIDGMAVDGNTRTIEKIPGALTQFVAVDSRGYAGGSVTLCEKTVAYVPLTLAASAARTDPTSGNAQLTVRGNCYCGSFGTAENALTLAYSVDDGEEVLLPLQVEENHTYSHTVSLSGLDYRQEHILRVRVYDAVDAAETKNIWIGKGIPVFDWGENDFRFHVPVSFAEGLSVGGKTLADLFYPVGSVYLSVYPDDPAGVFGGSWEQIKDRFLLAAGDTYPAGTTGGSAEHTLTLQEMPAHSHSGKYITGQGSSDGIVPELRLWENETQFTAQATDAVGGGEAFSVLPPYLAVYMWKRVA